MDLRRHLGGHGQPEGQSQHYAPRPAPAISQRGLARSAQARPSFAEARRPTAPTVKRDRASRTPAGNITATWIGPGRFRLDMSYSLIGTHPDGTEEVLTWPPLSLKAAWAGSTRRASGTSPVELSIEVAANQPVEVRLSKATIGGLISSLMGNDWGEVLVVDNAGVVSASPLAGHNQPIR